MKEKAMVKRSVKNSLTIHSTKEISLVPGSLVSDVKVHTFSILIMWCNNQNKPLFYSRWLYVYNVADVA